MLDVVSATKGDGQVDYATDADWSCAAGPQGQVDELVRVRRLRERLSLGHARRTRLAAIAVRDWSRSCGRWGLPVTPVPVQSQASRATAP